MSFQASKWAADQKAGNPSAKSVLYALANYADFNGKVFASQQRIAEDTEQSVDSVQRRLKELERRGLIYRTPQTRLEKGRGAGSWSVSFTILLMDDLCLSFALKHGYDPSAASAKAAETGAVSGCEDGVQENQAVEADAGPQVAVRSEFDAGENNQLADSEQAHRTADCGPANSGHRTADCGSNRTALLRHRIVNSEPISPLTPRSSSPEVAVLDEGSWLAEWERLKKLYPVVGDEALDRARKRFRDLSPADRAIALKAAANYVQAKRAIKQPPMSLRNFLHPDNFRPWENKTCGEKVFVIRDTDAWRAWVAYSGRNFPPFKRIIEGKPVEGWFFDSLYPPARASPARAAE